MGKSTTPAADAAPATAEADATEATAYELTLTEFCARLSATDKRVEMIAGFEFSEKQAGRLKDYETAFADRFAAFQTQPA